MVHRYHHYDVDEDEDEEMADAVWKAVDDRMESRRKDRQKLELERSSNSEFIDGFKDLRGKSVEYWESIPECENFMPVPDTVLEKARKEKDLQKAANWISAAKFVEATDGNTEAIGNMIEKGLSTLQTQGVFIDRESWMKEAESAEHSGYFVTCQAVIKHTIGIGVKEEDREGIWVADAQECENRGSIETARAIYAHTLSVFSTKESIWLKATLLEKNYGTRDSLDALLLRAVTYVPQAEVLWLMGAKEKCLAGDMPAARAILQQALFKLDLEFDNHEPQRARMLLANARARGANERLWMKSAIDMREVGNSAEERRLLDEALRRFPSFFKLWLMLGQLQERLGLQEKAKEAYEAGLNKCPHCIPLWISLASLVEKMNTGGLSKARTVLTMSRKMNPSSPELWLASVRAELRHGNKREAHILMAKALQECPNSGILWAVQIEMVSPLQRITKSSDALKRCGHDPYVMAAVANLFWHERKLDMARIWLNRAVTCAPDIGDFWALYYLFELEHGSEESQKDIMKQCVAAQPKHGEKWQAVSKAVDNAHLPTQVILKKVVMAIGREENACFL